MGEAPAPGRRISAFANHREAIFVSRPNRFLIIAQDGEEVFPCHCPNPGRLLEFCLPGMPLILEKREASSNAKTQWTVVGIRYSGGVVPLFSARANQAAAELVLEHIIPSLGEVRSEYTIGNSRFDFFCRGTGNSKHLVEVKACSLVEYGVAMFPDAPSGRASKHLAALAQLSAEGYIGHILFVIVHGNPRVFIPNLHTDPMFSASLSMLGSAPGPGEWIYPPGTVAVHAALLASDERGSAGLAQAHIPVDLSQGELAAENSGSYLMLLELPEDRDIAVGALGTRLFRKGWYVYAGSAMKNLSQRVARHTRKARKLQHWHIDYLTPYSSARKALPIMSYANLECALAEDVAALGGEAIPGFGSSDCRCASHCFYFSASPLRNPAFVDLLFRYRHRECFVR